MLIQVTQEDIDSGRRLLCGPEWRPRSQYCPIALAIERAICAPVWVGDTVWGFKGGPVNRTLPRAAAEWADDFDQGRPVAPFEFELYVEPAA
jgi:hypothetical protein